jgi:hypothetical protein
MKNKNVYILSFLIACSSCSYSSSIRDETRKKIETQKKDLVRLYLMAGLVKRYYVRAAN